MMCQTANIKDSPMLLCDFCDSGCHLKCTIPRIDIIPDTHWYCCACYVSGLFMQRSLLTHIPD